ncbi:MAG: hypothetical protein PVJ20_00700 [Desulfobacterales bacterium]|jgi:hypothetical protein
MSLKQDLDDLKEKSSKNIPQDTLNIMSADTELLKKSGITDRSLKTGDTIPSFSLSNAKSELISSSYLVANGPLVLSFYRGGW